MSKRRLSFASVFLTPAALAAGAAFGLWLYRRWGYAVDEHEHTVARVDPPPEADGPGIQHADDGTGARFHRTYRVHIANATLSPEALFAKIGESFDPFVAPEVAQFEKTKGEPGALASGDEYLVHINAPWNGPVRVVETEPTRFVLATLDGHMEAGQIEFRAEGGRGKGESGNAQASGARGGMESPAKSPLPEGEGQGEGGSTSPNPDTAPEASGDGAAPEVADSSQSLTFTIESWARSRDALVDLVYDDLGVAKVAQQAMWTYFCRQVAEVSGGEMVGEIDVLTEREAT